MRRRHTVQDIQQSELLESRQMLTQAPFPVGETFTLHSNPSADHTIYLDFDGHVTTGTTWNTQFGSVVTPAYDTDGNPSSFSNVELETIQFIWERVVEDFSPFDVDVTTEEPADISDLIDSGGNDTRWGIRIAIGGASDDWYKGGVGEIANSGAFRASVDEPGFVFYDDLYFFDREKQTADAISQTVGQSLGLRPDGFLGIPEYTGHGAGATGWAPIMGDTRFRELTQWSRGEYRGSDNPQDDLRVITTQSGFGYRADLAGDTTFDAATLGISGVMVDQAGIIETSADIDVFRFRTGDGPVSFDIQPWHRSPNLDLEVSLLDSTGTVLATSNPIDELGATISTTLAQGEYFLRLDGVGEGDPINNYFDGYTDYGSIGQFTITGMITEPARIDVEVVGGDLVLTDTFDYDSDLTVQVRNGAITITSQLVDLGALTGVTQVSPTQVTVPLTSVTGTVILDLAAGDDNVLLQMPNGFVDLPFDFQAGLGTDSFTISGPTIPTSFSVVTYTRSDLMDGDVAYTSSGPSPAVTYSALERYTDETVADSRDVQITGDIPTIQVDAGANPNDGRLVVTSAGGTTLDFGAPGLSLQIDTSSSPTANTVTIRDFAGELSAALSVLGDVGDFVTLASPFDPGMNAVSLAAGTVDINEALGGATSSADLSLSAVNLNVNAQIESSGTLRIQPLNPMSSIGVGDASAGTLLLSDALIAQLGSQFQQIQIGDAAAAMGSVNVTSGSFSAPLLITGSDISVTGLDSGIDAVELVAQSGAITSLADTMAPGFTSDVSGGEVTLRTSGAMSGAIGTLASPIYVSTTSLVTDSTASGDDQFLATLDPSVTVSSAAGGVFEIVAGKFDAGASDVFANAAGLSFSAAGTGTFDLAGNSVSVSSISGAGSGGTVELGSETLTIDGSQTATFNGQIAGTGNLVKSGSGTEILGGVNTYVGTTVIDAGSLLVDGSLAGDVALAGGVLGGSGIVAGSVGSLSAGGGISPGSSPGKLTVSGDVTLDDSESFVVEIEGLTPGTQHDQLVMDGAPTVLTLLDPVLNASLNGYVPTPGDEITIIDLVDPASVVVGSFADLPEGTAVEIDGYAFAISYFGGTDGNDVVLTSVPTGVRVVAMQSSVTEDSGGAVTFQFQRFGDVSSSASVNFSVTGLADASDFVLTGATSYDSGTGIGSVDLLASETTFDIQITPLADSEYELDEDVVVTVDPGAGYLPGSTVTDSTVIENDDVGISLSISQPSVPEQGPGTLVYTFTRLESTAGTLSVNFGIAGSSTATLGLDYRLTGATTFSGSSGVVVFADGQATFDIVVTPVDDNLFELPETVTIVVLPGAGYDPSEPLELSSQTGTIVNEDNALPTLNPISPVIITEDDPMQTIGLSGITAGFSDQQNLRVTAVSSRPDIIPDPTVVYTSPQATGQLQFTSLPDSWGPLTFTVTVEDGGLDDDLMTTGDNLTFSRIVDVVVRPVNDDPTLDVIANENVNEDSGEHTVPLTGVSPGPKEFEPFRITAVSSDTALIPFIAIDHDPQAPMGVLRYRTGSELSGLATITVMVTDAGADGTLTTPGDNLTIVQTFDVMVNPVNDPPTIDPLSAVIIDEDSGIFEIDLTGISGGPGEAERVDLSVRTLNTSGMPDQSIIPDPTILSYTPGDDSAILRLTPVLNAFGDAIIELTLTDYGFDDNFGTMGDNTARVVTFSVGVRPVNDPPVAMDQTFMLPESSPADTLVGSIVATDVDSDRLRYEILSGNTNNAFKIDTNSGDLLVNNQGALDLETQPTFNLMVAITDLGSPPESTTIEVTVDLNDLNPEGALVVNPNEWLSNSLIVRRAGAMFENIEIVDTSGTLITSAPAAEVDRIIINGNDDIAESVLVDFRTGNAFGNGDAVPPLGLTFNAGAGDVEDSLEVQARLSDVFAAVDHTLTGPDTATILANDNLITLNGVERIQDTLRSATRSIVLTGNDDLLTLRAGISEGDFLAELESAGTVPAVTFGTPVSGMTIDLGAGNDTFTAESFEIGLRGRLTVLGNDGDDSFFIGGLNGDPVTLGGGDGNDSVFEVLGSNLAIRDDAIVDLAGGSGLNVMAAISGIEMVSATGTEGDDILDASSFTGSVNLMGLAGDDLLIGGLGDDVIDGGNDRDRLIGGPGNDQLFGGSRADTISGNEGIDTIDGQGGGRPIAGDGKRHDDTDNQPPRHERRAGHAARHSVSVSVWRGRR